MRIIVSDTSCMIDLMKAALLDAVLALPHTFVMPNTLFDEWLSLSAKDKKALRNGGLDVRELPGASVAWRRSRKRVCQLRCGWNERGVGG